MTPTAELMPTTHRTYWLPATIVAAFLAVAVFAIITYINTGAIRESEEVAAKTHAVREAIQQTLSAMKDAETGQRGFLLTGYDTFLEPHEVGIQKAIEQLASLNELTSDDEEVHKLVAEIERSFQAQQAHLSQTIAMRRRSPQARISDEILDLVKSGRGKAAMDDATAAAKSILAIEEKRLTENEDLARERTVISRTTITAGNLLALTLISFVGLAAVVDRRKRDQAERELVKQQHELQAVIESAFEGIITYDDDLTIRYMNPAAAEILRIDFTNNLELKWNLLQFVPAERRESARQRNQAFNESGQNDLAFKSLTLLRSDGEDFLCEGTAIRTVAENDHFTTFKFRDVSETQVLKARQREYAVILNQVQEAIVVCDLNDRIQSWNTGAEKLYGISREAALGQDISILLFGDRLHEWAAGNNALKENGTHTTEFSRIGPAGHDMVIEKRRSLIFDDENRPIAQLLFMIDATERVREEARERRSQRLESIGTLAGGVAHDLNNVLTPIMMSAMMLKRGSQTPERLMDNIISSADRGARMIQKLLAFAGGEKTDRQQVDVREVLMELQEILSHTLPPTIELQVRVPPKLWPIDADNTELSQVVMNLAINARDAMPNGGQLVIEVEDFHVDAARAARSDNLYAGPHIQLTVADTGEGIPKEIIDRIFDPFFTTKAQGKGTGLGLATTIGIVRSYGGEISVYSEPGIGTKFSILLPTSKLASTVATTVDIGDEIQHGNGETILVVDDEAMIVEAVSETLNASRYHVLTAHTGQEAIATFKQQGDRIDCVLLDMMMPGMDGFQTKDALLAIDAQVKIIASSGLRRPGREETRLLGIRGFLPKPYTDEQLLRLVRDVLSNTP